MGRNDSAAWKGANPSKLRSLGRWQPQAAELQVPVLRSKCCLIWGLGKVLKGLCHLVSSGTSQLPPLCVTSFSAVVENMSRALLHPSDNSGWHQVGFLGGGEEVTTWLLLGNVFSASPGDAVCALPLGCPGGSITRGLGWFVAWSEGRPLATASLAQHQLLFLLFLSSPASAALSLSQQKAELFF